MRNARQKVQLLNRILANSIIHFQVCWINHENIKRSPTTEHYTNAKQSEWIFDVFKLNNWNIVLNSVSIFTVGRVLLPWICCVLYFSNFFLPSQIWLENISALLVYMPKLKMNLIYIWMWMHFERSVHVRRISINLILGKNIFFPGLEWLLDI